MSRTLKAGLYFALSLFMIAILKFFPHSRFAENMATSTIGLWTIPFMFLTLFFLILTMKEALQL